VSFVASLSGRVDVADRVRECGDGLQPQIVSDASRDRTVRRAHREPWIATVLAFGLPVSLPPKPRVTTAETEHMPI
jgi:hypothetical protein